MSRRPVRLLDVAALARGEIEATLCDLRPATSSTCVVERMLSHVRVPANTARQRHMLSASLDEEMHGGAGASVLWGDLERDIRGLTLTSMARTIALWDFEHIVAPLIPQILGEGPCFLLSAGRCDVNRFGVRGALREAIRSGLLERGVLLEICSIPYWFEWREGFVAWLAALATAPPDDVVLTRTRLVVGPDAPNCFLEAMAPLDPGLARKILAEHAAEVGFAAALALLRTELIEEARRAGVEVIDHAVADDALRPASGAGSTLLLIAHQDDAGVHLWDGPLSINAWMCGLASQARRRTPKFATVDLAVCGADAPAGLASLFQAAGARAVLTRGAVAFQAPVMATLREMLVILRTNGPAPLPLLADAAWLSLLQRKARG